MVVPNPGGSGPGQEVEGETAADQPGQEGASSETARVEEMQASVEQSEAQNTSADQVQDNKEVLLLFIGSRGEP